jgi:hypothetical protein
VTPSRWLAALLGVAIVANVLLGVDRSFAQSEARRWRTSYDSLTKLSARVDTQYVRDTIRLRGVALVRYDTARVRDTLWRDSVVYVPRAVADEAVAACLAVVETCEERVSLRDQRIAALEAEGRALAAQRPGLRDKAKGTVLTIVIWEGGKAVLRALAP